jgi:hypothetical protein
VVGVDDSGVLQKAQDDLWDALRSGTDLRRPRLREFALSSLGDALTLGHATRSPGEYLAVQGAIAETLRAALTSGKAQTDTPVVVVAQSLGGQVISNYLWDYEHKRFGFESRDEAQETPTDRFCGLRTLARLITTGCNLPLFVSGLADRRSFTPLPGMEWHNFYDPADVLGWPLAGLGADYAFVRDHRIRSGKLPVGRVIASHLGYWRDRDVHRGVAAQVRAVLAAG